MCIYRYHMNILACETSNEHIENWNLTQSFDVELIIGTSWAACRGPKTAWCWLTSLICFGEHNTSDHSQKHATQEAEHRTNQSSKQLVEELIRFLHRLFLRFQCCSPPGTVCSEPKVLQSFAQPVAPAAKIKRSLSFYILSTSQNLSCFCCVLSSIHPLFNSCNRTGQGCEMEICRHLKLSEDAIRSLLQHILRQETRAMHGLMCTLANLQHFRA